MAPFPYTLTDPIGTRATLGLIVLQVDETIEHDFRRLFPAAGIALHVSRIPSGDELTPDTIAAMKATLPAAAALLPPAAKFDAVAYGCTSGTTLIGADAVAELVRKGVQTRHIADPLTAACAALDVLEARSVALVSPYIETVARPIRSALEKSGLTVPGALSFGEEVEAQVARIDPRSIRAAALEVGRSPAVDAVFLSCTNLRTMDIIDDLERELAKPVLSSNLVLAWQLARLAGVEIEGPGSIFRSR